MSPTDLLDDGADYVPSSTLGELARNHPVPVLRESARLDPLERRPGQTRFPNARVEWVGD